MDVFAEPLTPEEYTLEYAVANLLTAKHDEDEYKSLRIKWEELVAAKIPGPDSGQKTVKLEDGTSVTVKRGFNYKADCPALMELAIKLELEHVPVKQKTTHELDEKGYEWYRSNDLAVFNKLSEMVTITPKKVSVEVKRK